MVKKNQAKILAKSYFSSNNFAKTFWEQSEWGGENGNELLLAVRFGTLFIIGLLTNLPPGDVTS
jgi:hypothetical protein